MYVQSIWNKQAVTEYRERRNEARVMMPQGGRVSRDRIWILQRQYFHRLCHTL